MRGVQHCMRAGHTVARAGLGHDCQARPRLAGPLQAGHAARCSARCASCAATRATRRCLATATTWPPWARRGLSGSTCAATCSATLTAGAQQGNAGCANQGCPASLLSRRSLRPAADLAALPPTCRLHCLINNAGVFNEELVMTEVPRLLQETASSNSCSACVTAAVESSHSPASSQLTPDAMWPGALTPSCPAFALPAAGWAGGDVGGERGVALPAHLPAHRPHHVRRGSPCSRKLPAPQHSLSGAGPCRRQRCCECFPGGRVVGP